MPRHAWLVLAVAVLACSDKAVLRYRPRRDGVHQYVMTMRYTREDARILSASSRYSETWTIYYTQFGRSTDARGSGSELLLRIDSVEVPSSQGAPDLSSMKGRTMSVFLDGRGQLLRTQRDTLSTMPNDVMLGLQAMAAATGPSFPQEPVEAGDRWTMTRRSTLEDFGIGGESPGDLELDATLGAIRESLKDKVAEVGIHGSLPARALRVVTSLGPLPARSTGTLIGQYRFSLPRGVMLSQELTGRLVLVTDAPMVGRDTLLSRLVTQTTIHLQ